MSESYSAAQVEGLARKQAGGGTLNSWEQAAVDRSANQAGSQGNKLRRIIAGEER